MVAEKADSSLWMSSRKRKSHASLRFFCLPYAGGGASIFRTWSDYLPDEVEVCPIQLPGRENRLHEVPFTSLSSLVQAMAEALYSYCDLPFAFFGHSLGGLLAFELARSIRKEYRLNPAYLFISGFHAPQLQYSISPIHQLSDAAFLASISSLGGTPEAVLQNTELINLLLPTLRADFTLYETYEYAADVPLHCPLSVFGGLQDKNPLLEEEKLKLWREHAEEMFSLRMLPGGHFFLQEKKELLLKYLSSDLERLLNRRLSTL